MILKKTHKKETQKFLVFNKSKECIKSFMNIGTKVNLISDFPDNPPTTYMDYGLPMKPFFVKIQNLPMFSIIQPIFLQKNLACIPNTFIWD